MGRPDCANVPVRVRFRSGHVISAQYLEHQATSGPNEASTDQCVTGQTVQTSDYGSVLTPLELFQLVKRLVKASDDNCHLMDVAYDRATGLPLQIDYGCPNVLDGPWLNARVSDVTIER